MSGLLSTGKDGGLPPSRYVRTDVGVHKLNHNRYDLNGQTDVAHQENLSHLNQINRSLKISKPMLGVDKKLGNFGNEARKLGRSFSLLVATKNLRHQLVGIEFLSRQNDGPLERFYRKDMAFNPSPYSFPQRRKIDMIAFAHALEEFRRCIQDFHEYGDDTINVKGALQALCSDIKYWTSSLDAYEQSDSNFVEEYANQLIDELKARITEMSSNLQLFTEIGMPAIRYEQRRKASVLLALSTGATFFSGVTATMLQVSYTIPASRVAAIVNTFWFCSLVLSVGAAINSSLAMLWKQTIHGTRGSKHPRWLTWWINGSPPTFLFISIICFSAGLVLFVFSSDQSPFTSWLALAATIVTSFAFSANILWMLYEQISAWISPPSPSTLDEGSLSRHDPDFYQQKFTSSNISVSSLDDLEEPGRGKIDMLLTRLGREFEPAIMPIPSLTVREVGVPLKGSFDVPRMENLSSTKGEEQIRPTFISYCNLQEFGALRDFKSSPDGKYLATTSWRASIGKSTTVIFSDFSEYQFNRRQEFETRPKSNNGPGQLTWSYDSAHLLVRYDRIVDVWTLEPRKLKRITRSDPIQTVRWYGREQAFLCIEKHSVTKVNLDGKEEWKCFFPNIHLYDASVASKNRLVLLGHIVSFNDMKPSNRSAAEKQIRVCQIEEDKKSKHHPLINLNTPKIPLLDDVNHIMPASNKDEFLVSYRSQKPPQIWSLPEKAESPDLKLECSYQPIFKDEFEGVSYTSKDSNDLALSTGRDGDIHFWNWKNGKPVHHFRAGGGSFLCAWFPGTVPGVIRFATGNINGISVWEYGGAASQSEKLALALI
ncbi:hypothetical protein BDZ94DRAFT_87994 [Collybia nuda]|uniref:Uncharacterized protein n=1 Tax=Collybia nuda TaxID=64659 RepID=A0A9P6CNQ0_9AGAR|nr:hypothetical protein BDZ94DRAFT_87994 [Collybia nuda]